MAPRPSIDTPVVLIGGCPRSGTTPLMLLLNSDPRVFVSSEENLVELVVKLDAVLSTRERLQDKAGGRMRERSVRETASLGDLHRYNFSRAFVTGTLAEIYRIHHRALNRGAELKLFGDKYPRYYENLGSVFTLPLAVKYIHITRNPFDVVNSMLRRTRMAEQGKDWWKTATEPEKMIGMWNAAFEAVVTRQAEPEILHLQYEDLVFRTDAVKARLCDFLGVELDLNYALVSDPEKHFDRSYIDPAVARLIGSSAHIDRYQRYLREQEGGSAALEALSR